jgi:UDP-N-acetylglucosamine--N-acetylmuramyl-(pentapeptide) pyrophosphoryl-undecaprenol N-acetylglucosamine transferase
MNNMRGPTLLIMAGGTGGHIFPGIAVAEYLVSQGWNIHWLGTDQRMEADVVPKHGFDISFINITGLRNKGWQTWLITPLRLVRSVYQSIGIIRKVNPDVVLGMGGYASAPGGLAAWLLRKPLILHEQNAVAGMSNRYLANLAAKVLSAFPGAFSQRLKAQVIGNPIRKEILAIKKSVPEQPATSKKVLVVGGSLGAKVLNDTVPKAINQIKLQHINVWHQTGKGHKQSVIDNYQQYEVADQQVKVTEFIDDMAAAYLWADVVICRAGALTVSELAIAGKPAIFVPLPHAVDDHQTKNAMYLVNKNAAKLITQQELNGTSLAQMLNSLFISDTVVQSMAKAAHNAAHANATVDVAQICIEQSKQ